MTNRERLFAALSGADCDRVPSWLLFPYHRYSSYTDVRANPCYRSIVEASLREAITLDRRNLSVPVFAPEVRLERTEERDGAAYLRREFVRGPGVELVCEHGRAADGARREKRYLTSEEELRAYASLPFNTDPRAIDAELERLLPAYLREKAEFPQELGAMMLCLGEPIGELYHASSMDEFPVWSLTCDAVVRGILDRHMERVRRVYRFCLERDLADVYFMVGSELAAPPMVSRETFRRWVLPYARELIGLVHAYGKKVIQHFHGQVRDVLPDFVEMGADGLHTIEAPPTGNCTLAEAFARTGNRITLIGNIQYDFFRSASEREMREAVRSVIAEAAGRRFILSPTAGPYEETISAQVQRNYLTFLAAGSEYGRR